MQELIIKDNTENEYIVQNPVQFYMHLLKFHADNGFANLSLHEENGHYFTVTHKLLEDVKLFIQVNKK